MDLSFILGVCMSERKRRISQCLQVVGFILIACMVSFSSCEIGLGSAVDIQPPLVSISYPTVDSVIREDFLMAGTASDETSVASVSVSLENINTGAVYGPYSGTIDSGAGT